jgi:hypothetical protein
MSESDDPKFGDFAVLLKDGNQTEAKFDRLAKSGRGELLLVSLVTETQRLKQIRALLSPSGNNTAKVVVEASGVRVRRPGDSEWLSQAPGRLYPTPDGYQVRTHRLGYGLVHALFLTRMPGFMKVVTPESLWRELAGARFTTPVLREWVPFLEGRLREEERLEDAHGFNCRCGVLTATTTKLDEIVSEGLAQRSLLIPRPTAA